MAQNMVAVQIVGPVTVGISVGNKGWVVSEVLNVYQYPRNDIGKIQAYHIYDALIQEAKRQYDPA